MRVRVISDIHLEFLDMAETDSIIQKIVAAKEDRDVLVLPGDIGYPELLNYTRFVQAMSRHFRWVFLLPGNHEYYRSTVEETDRQIERLCTILPNVVFLKNTMMEYGGYVWIGATLWSHITNPNFSTNDTRHIHGLDVDGYNRMHQQDRRYLQDALQAVPSDKKMIVMTHHLPSFQLIARDYKDNPYNQCFAADMDDLLRSHHDRIVLWVHGHTHTPLDRHLHGIRIVCNPIGYRGENHHSDFAKTVVL